MNFVPLVESTRGFGTDDARENLHFGAVAVVDSAGHLLYSAGDPKAIAFTRSALKPVQALPLVLSGAAARFGFGPPELALACASHSGEPQHVGRVNAMLTAIGASARDLQCGTHPPLYYSALGRPVPPDAVFSAVHNNCSGKHTGFLAWCRHHGAPVESYLELDHPLQADIARLAAAVGGSDDLPRGRDGCSAPNFALPLYRLAHLYARLAQPGRDPEFGHAFETLFAAMTGYPDLVSGEGRHDLAIMRCAPKDWVSKAGADGVEAFGSRSRGLGIAVKVADGSPRALMVAFIETLAQLGLLDGRDTGSLAPWRAPTLTNHRGLTVGSVRPVFSLTRH